MYPFPTSRKEVQGVSLSTASRWTSRVYPFLHNQQNGRAGCNHFHSQEYGRAVCRVSAFPPLAVWTWKGVGGGPWIPFHASSMNVKGVSLSTASRMGVQGAPVVWTCRVYPFFKCRNVGRSGIHTMPMPSCVNDDLSNEPNFGRIISLDSTFKIGLQISL